MLHMEHLCIRLGDFALHDVSLDVATGEYLCLVGPTGAGKTILLECIAGLHQPDSGSVTFDGLDLTALPPEERNVGYVPQDYALFPHMDVTANIAYGLQERRLPNDEIQCKVQEMAALLQIEHLLSRRITTLSGGERQRVALARALVLECRVLLLDEPLGALDWVTTRELSRYLADLHRRLGLTVLHVTHDFSEAYSLASRVGVVDKGRLLQVGTVQDVFQRPASPTVASFVGQPNVWSLSDAPPLLCDQLLARTPELANAAFLCIRPDCVSLSREANPVPTTATAALGTVLATRWLGPVSEVTVDVGAPLSVTISSAEATRLGLDAGDAVTVTVAPDAVHALHEQ